MSGDKHRSREITESVLNLHKGRGDFALTNIVSEIVLALGTTKGNAMYLKDLAKMVNLSEQRAESYIKLYLDGEHKLFRKIINEQGYVKDSLKGGIGQKSKNGVMYGLTNEGLQYFYKMPIYSRLRGSLAYNFLSKITLTSHPRNIYRRLALLTYTGGVAALAAMILPFGFVLTGLWLFLTTIIGTFMASGSTC
jgi:predicted transcriptional regulator